MASRKKLATGQINLGAAPEGRAGKVAFQIVDDGAMNVSIVPKIRMPGLGAELIAVPYTKRSDGTQAAAATAIVGEGAFEVESNGFEVVLDTTLNAGAGTVHYLGVAA